MFACCNVPSTFTFIQVVPLPNVNAAILKKVIQWATYHKDDPPLPEDDENKEKRTDDISSWDAEFLKVGTHYCKIPVIWGSYIFYFMRPVFVICACIMHIS